jgi:ferredoxin
VARVGSHTEAIYQATGNKGVGLRTGATLVDFVQAGAREIPSGLLYPASYLVTNAYFEVDVVINAANCRTGPPITGMSGAIKNMFGCVVGKRKQQIHNLFGSDRRLFGRAIADIHRTIPAHLSFLDLTTVREAFGPSQAVRQVGVLLASVDPVALDSVAAEIIGYRDPPLWTTYYGSKYRVGCRDLGRIEIRGTPLHQIVKLKLSRPSQEQGNQVGRWERFTRVLNATLLRPRPVVAPDLCTSCGKCAERCPVGCIGEPEALGCVIDLRRCGDCLCCQKVCPEEAIRLEFTGVAGALRRLSGKSVVAEEAPVGARS